MRARPDPRDQEPGLVPAGDPVPADVPDRLRRAACRASRKVPGFDFPSGYTAFQFVFVFLQSAAFGGVFTGFAIAYDFESGFSQRLLLATPHRAGLILGYIVTAATRFLPSRASCRHRGGLIGGMRIDGSGADLIGLRHARAGRQRGGDAVGDRDRAAHQDACRPGRRCRSRSS